ncbi:MAG: hypothetical protein HC880_00805 [Bacteroidia bacterium]|nr:hypothetical protein [Bacteroidia bacterium]
MLAQLINNPSKDGQIGDGVYAAYEWIVPDFGPRRLCRVYIGTRAAGPILQYDAPRELIRTAAEDEYDLPASNHHYNGREHVLYPDGAWTPAYSRGNYRRNYACGGNWNGHNRNLHHNIQRAYNTPDETWQQDMVMIGSNMVPAPDGIAPDGTLTSIDCSGSWGIFYKSAADAMRYRLSRAEIATSTLPRITKNHLIKKETDDVIARVMEVVDAYKL